MSMIPHFRRLFAYDGWANREVLASLQVLKATPPRSLKFLAHILSGERLWLGRLLAQKQTQPVWPDFSLEQCGSEIAELPDFWKNYLSSLNEDDLPHDLTYKNSKGESWTNQKQDILTHVIMHSAYHRGQIAADIRSAGFTPPNTDFIHAVRKGFLEDSE
jgi:uncharacterized damage-inducible protein DinB